MNKKIILIGLFASAICTAKAAANAPDTAKVTTSTDVTLTFSGSVDTYYKYDFAGHANIPTSFANEHNSISIGMVDLGLKKTVGNASFVGELSFGPRGQSQSIPNASPGLVTLN